MRMVHLPTVDAGTPPFTDEVCICISPCFEPSVTVGVYTSIKCPLTQTDHIHTPPTSSNMKMFTTFSLILLSTSTYVNALPAALPVENFTFPLIRLEGTGAYLEGAVNASRARASFLKSRTPVGPSSMTVLSSGAQLVVEVGVGNPVAYQHLLVDTGTPVTWM